MSRPRYSVQVKDSEERADQIASDRPVDGPQVAAWSPHSWIAIGAARLARLTRSSAPLVDSFARWRR
jgi:hypothetical protein